MIPIRHENMTARRWPVVTLSLIVINVVVFLFTISAIDCSPDCQPLSSGYTVCETDQDCVRNEVGGVGKTDKSAGNADNSDYERQRGCKRHGTSNIAIGHRCDTGRNDDRQ